MIVVSASRAADLEGYYAHQTLAEIDSRRARLGRIPCGTRPAFARRRPARRRWFGRGAREHRHRYFLWRAHALRAVGLASTLRLCVASGDRLGQLAPLYGRALDLYRRIWLVLGFLRALRVGRLSLRPLGLRSRLWLVLGPRRHLGSGLGAMALQR